MCQLCGREEDISGGGMKGSAGAKRGHCPSISKDRFDDDGDLAASASTNVKTGSSGEPSTA